MQKLRLMVKKAWKLTDVGRIKLKRILADISKNNYSNFVILSI